MKTLFVRHQPVRGLVAQLTVTFVPLGTKLAVTISAAGNFPTRGRSGVDTVKIELFCTDATR